MLVPMLVPTSVLADSLLGPHVSPGAIQTNDDVSAMGRRFSVALSMIASMAL